jgi:diguanylate cyclase (GGDEF)-like protein
MREKWLVSFVFVLIILTSLHVAYKSSNFNALQTGDAILLTGDAFSPSFDARNFSFSGQAYLTYKTRIPKSAFGLNEKRAYTLVLYRLADNAHRIYFNDVIIGSKGDYNHGDSNLWNGLFTYNISPSLIEENNVLRIETTASYRTGLSDVPIYIVDADSVGSNISKLKFYGEQLNTLMIGFIVFSSVITLLFYFIDDRDKTYLLITVATLFTGIHYSSYLTFEAISVPYLVYKKVVMSSLFLAVAFYGYVMSRYFDKKFIRDISHFTVLGTLLMAIIASDMVIYKQLYTYGYLFLLINIMGWVFAALKEIKKSYVAFIFSISFVTLGVYASVVAMIDIIGGYFSFNSPIVYISVMATIPLLLIYEAIQEKDLLLVQEKSLREKEFKHALTDDLTGTWNQRYIATLFDQDLGHYTMAMLDIDNFKGINDTYGHLAGDYILKEVATLLKMHLRKSDVICRYGGDEFIVIMNACPVVQGHRILEHIRKEIEKTNFIYEEINIHVTVSVGLLETLGERKVEQVFDEVDVLLYKAKTEGRNRIALQ